MGEWLKSPFTEAVAPTVPALPWDTAPIAELLLRLREEAALRPYLGLQECKTLLKSLGKGYGVEDAKTLDILLAALLVKNKADRAAVPLALEAFFQKRALELDRQVEAVIRALDAQKVVENPTGNKQGAGNRQQEVEPILSPQPSATETQEAIGAAPKYETEVQMELMLSASTASLASIKPPDGTNAELEVQPPQGHPFILTDDYQPVSRRQMDQIWRFLRKPSRTGAQAKDLDLHRTVERLARQGWLDQPEWQREKLNKVQLLLLIDHSNSMLAWHGFGRQLVASALQGGGHRHAEVFWFSNLPHEFESAKKPGLLFKDTAHRQTEKIENLLRRCSNQNTEVLIFSDGGAARGGQNEKRAQLTKEWIEMLKKNTSSVSWLNPMPYTRWWGSTAELTHYEVAMFEANQRGLMAAINHLRGR